MGDVGNTWLTAKPETDLDVLAIEESVQEHPHGIVKDWLELHRLLGDQIQVIYGTFIGCRDPALIPEYPTTGLDQLHDRHDLVITADDSTSWWVSAPTAVSDRLKHTFPHAEERNGFS